MLVHVLSDMYPVAFYIFYIVMGINGILPYLYCMLFINENITIMIGVASWWEKAIMQIYM